MPVLSPTDHLQPRFGVSKIMLMKKQQKTLNRLSHVFSPYSVFLLLIAVFFSVPAAYGAAWYVKPSSEVPIRSGQGTEYKILAVVADGLKVELLEEVDPWAKVRTPGGTEGWMLKRYLSGDRPLSEAVASLTAQKTELETKNEEINRQLVEISAAQTKSEEELQICLADRNNVQQEYQTLQEDTADVIKIKNDLADKIQEAQEARQKLAAIEQENSDLRRNTTLMWVLAGGFLVIVGWIIGMMTGKSRKRKSSLL